MSGIFVPIAATHLYNTIINTLLDIDSVKYYNTISLYWFDP